MVAKTSNVDNDVALRVLTNLTQFLFGNVERYLTMHRGDIDLKDYEELLDFHTESDEP